MFNSMKKNYRILAVYILKLGVNLKMNKTIPGHIPVVSSQDDFLCLSIAYFLNVTLFFSLLQLYSNVNLLNLAEL